MSTTTTTTSSSSGGAATSSSSFFLQNIANLGLGYAIAIAVGLLVLLSTLLLASYVCCRASSRRRGRDTSTDPGDDMPRIIFVAEDDDDSDNGGGGASAATGLDPVAIASYPSFAYSVSKVGDPLCSICLSEYKEGEMVRMMPDCRHCFHLPCIDAWLRLNASCPVCRNSPMPTPLSTPLSELVPLSHFAADRRRG